MRRLIFILTAVVAAGQIATASADPADVRVGVLKFGTVTWELDVIRRHGLDERNGIRLDVQPYAGTQATKVALQAGSVDVIVSDWLWVSRQRAAGADFTFAPFSTALGGLVVPAESDVRTLADLAGKRLGIAGGPLDKSWLLMRALARQSGGGDIAESVEPVFGAPPLLNEQILAGRVDAVISYWHYAARLNAAGLRTVIKVSDALAGLGVTTPVPMIGYVFSDAWAGDHAAAVAGFLAATLEAKKILAESNEEWLRISGLMRADDDATFRALRDGFLAGIPTRWGAAERKDAARIYEVLAALGGEKLVGPGAGIQPGTFWAGLNF